MIRDEKEKKIESQEFKEVSDEEFRKKQCFTSQDLQKPPTEFVSPRETSSRCLYRVASLALPQLYRSILVTSLREPTETGGSDHLYCTR